MEKQIIGKNDLINKIIEMKIQGKFFSDAVFEIAEKIYDGEIELTSTCRHGLKRFNHYKKLGKFEFCEYIENVAKGWCGQTFGRI